VHLHAIFDRRQKKAARARGLGHRAGTAVHMAGLRGETLQCYKKAIDGAFPTVASAAFRARDLDRLRLAIMIRFQLGSLRTDRLSEAARLRV